MDSIKFTDSKNKEYYIFNNQIESFPIIGGEESNMITTQVWNQQGNTHINSLIEPYEGELIFILYTRNSQLDDIETGRRIINKYVQSFEWYCKNDNYPE